MSKNGKLQIELEPSLNIIDENKLNQSIEHDIKNDFSINNTDKNAKPAIRKTKTTRASSKQKQSKKTKSPKKNKEVSNKNKKRVKFTDKVDIIKVECWKKYNLEQTADECEYLDDYLDDFENGVTSKSNNNSNKNNDKNNNKEGEKNEIKNNHRKNKGNKPKKGNYTCVCNII